LSALHAALYFLSDFWVGSFIESYNRERENQSDPKDPREYFSLTSLGPKLQSIGLLRENLGALVF
tara:strand:- start:228 stop:422 length:195 start_codon:yes stop_codon:yes gene_type:complete